jgi:FkbM family methyltransferase
MKVLIISAFPPDPAPEANHALHISEHLAQSGLDVDVLCKTGSIAGTQNNIAVHPVIDDWTWSSLPRLARCMRRCRPDVVLLLYIGWVYNHQPLITFLPTICKAILPGVPCFTQFENIDTGFPPRSFLTRALRNAMALWAGGKDVHRLFGTLLRDSARIIVLSSPHRARLAAHCPEIEDKSVIMPPPPLIRFCQDPVTARRQARATIGAADGDFVLVYWGYVYPGKGVETLLEAFRIVYNGNRKIRLVIVGGSLEFPTGPISCGDYFQMVRELPERLGIAQRVTWTGHFDWDSDTGSRYLHAGDACVLPFDYGVTLNNSSLAAASTHGLPVIATNLPVGRDEGLEHGRNIYLCPPQDARALAEAIELVSDSADLRERLRLGILALARDWHDWNTMTRRLVEILAASREEARGHPVAQGDRAHLSSAVWSDETTADVNAPLVSVVVAVHNVGKYLSQCLDSLVNQTLKNIEIIVVNDASQDNSLEIVNAYAARYPQLIRVMTCESNKGLASVRNIGMKIARGSYISFTDGDDWADIRMCEVMYQRARDDTADVVIADATVFDEDSKTFGQFFDQPVRKTLRPELRTVPFDLRMESRVMLLEPVAWTKLYKRSFLQKHALQFEDGMNSYEDISFHFSVLLKAARISLLDDPLPFYRQNRPGQISARTNRKIFEVFAVFDKIHANLVAWGVSADIWALLVKVELRQFDWLLRTRVPSPYKREFLALAARQLQRIPEAGFQKFARQANRAELPKLLCMQRNWLYAYGKAANSRWPELPLLYLMAHPRRRSLLRRGYRHGLGMLRRRLISRCRSFGKRLLGWAALERRLQAVDDSLSQMTRVQQLPRQGEEPFVEVRRIHDQTLLLSHSEDSGFRDAIRRMEHDFYLSRTAAFREGDTVVDVGAHVGVLSIYLAKRYPFIRVYAIEPDPMNHACLKRNLELNGLTNVTAINKAVSGDGQKRRLYTNARFSGWATIDARTALSQPLLRSADIDTVTLDDLFDQYEIRHCRLLKITAPGAVQESLRAFTRSGCVDLLCGEVDLEDCSRAQLEMASWRIARQHFWRTTTRKGDGIVRSWIQQLPTEIERLPLTIAMHSR